MSAPDTGGIPPRPVALLVDDEPFVRAALRRSLARHGCDVIEASTGEEALKALATRADISAVISDVRMPGMSGPVLLEHVRRRFAGRPLKLILCTGDPTALDAGPTPPPDVEVLWKPFDFAALAATLRAAHLSLAEARRAT